MGRTTKKSRRQLSRRIYFNSKLTLFLLGIFFIFAILLVMTTNKSEDTKCANSVSCIKDLTGEYSNYKKGVFMGEPVQSPNLIASNNKNQSNVLGAEADNKHIYVDLTKQHLYAYEGEKLAMDFPISSGKWGLTPTGDFKIWIKLRYTRMTGGSKAIHTFYDLPNVPYTMYFYNDQVPKTEGYGLHGAYWHNNFGHPMSHGCVNISTANAEKLYNWATPVSTTNVTYSSDDNPGTPITIYGETPKE